MWGVKDDFRSIIYLRFIILDSNLEMLRIDSIEVIRLNVQLLMWSGG